MAPPKDTPCVYSHSAVIDWWSGTAKRRTCAELMSEANSRIQAQQAKINQLSEALEDRGGGLATNEDAPTLEGDVPSDD